MLLMQKSVMETEQTPQTAFFFNIPLIYVVVQLCMHIYGQCTYMHICIDIWHIDKQLSGCLLLKHLLNKVHRQFERDFPFLFLSWLFVLGHEPSYGLTSNIVSPNWISFNNHLLQLWLSSLSKNIY